VKRLLLRLAGWLYRVATKRAGPFDFTATPAPCDTWTFVDHRGYHTDYI
jgi:hypothetical protein